MTDLRIHFAEKEPWSSRQHADAVSPPPTSVAEAEQIGISGQAGIDGVTKRMCHTIRPKSHSDEPHNGWCMDFTAYDCKEGKKDTAGRLYTQSCIPGFGDKSVVALAFFA